MIPNKKPENLVPKTKLHPFEEWSFSYRNGKTTLVPPPETR